MYEDHIFTGDIASMLKQPETPQIYKVATQKNRTKSKYGFLKQIFI